MAGAGGVIGGFRLGTETKPKALPPETASSSPGHGGIVAISTERVPSPVFLNWNRVPVGMSKLTPGARSNISSTSPSLRHTCRWPSSTYQISSMVRCTTAVEVRPGRSVKWFTSPRLHLSRNRMAEPSGAVASGSGEREALCMRQPAGITW